MTPRHAIFNRREPPIVTHMEPSDVLYSPDIFMHEVNKFYLVIFSEPTTDLLTLS